MKSIMDHMDAVRIETTVDERGEVHLTKLPFPAGEPVEVIVVPKPARQQGGGFPLRGIPIAYDRPTDRADQIIVATARIHDCPLATADDKILNYAHVRTVGIG